MGEALPEPPQRLDLEKGPEDSRSSYFQALFWLVRSCRSINSLAKELSRGLDVPSGATDSNRPWERIRSLDQAGEFGMDQMKETGSADRINLTT